ncbi:hypothetical protein, partial [Priestia koreensis]|uniref:hypothetical protein n=1 Tax=Priestia koreensis TaxID=284581 RepID=UPI002041B02D
ICFNKLLNALLTLTPSPNACSYIDYIENPYIYQISTITFNRAFLKEGIDFLTPKSRIEDKEVV